MKKSVITVVASVLAGFSAFAEFAGLAVRPHDNAPWRTEAGAQVVFMADAAGAKGNVPQATAVGRCGESTGEILWRMTHGEMDGLGMAVVVLQVGAKNLERSISDEPPGETIYAVRRCVRTILFRNPDVRVVLCPVASADPRCPQLDRVERINRWLPRIADGKRVFWCRDVRHVGVIVNGLLGRGDMPSMSENSPPTTNRADVPRMSDWIDYRIGPKRAEILKNVSRHYDCVMIGDSLTHGWDKFGGEGQEIVLDGYRLLNLGFSGEVVSGILWDIEEGGLLEGYTADVVSLLIGVNDLGSNPDVSQVKMLEIAAGVKRCLTSIRAKQPQAKILLLPNLRGETPDDPLRRQVERLNGLVRSLADGKIVVWFDFTARLKNPDGTLDKALYPDFLHPKERGYDIWAEELLPYLRNRMHR